MKKVTGIGGIFFKCKDPKEMKEWYKTHLGMDTNEYGGHSNGKRQKIQPKWFDTLEPIF